MPDRFTESHIRNIPIFRNLPEPLFDTVASVFDVRRYNPGEVIFQQGDQTRGLQMFVSGQGILLRAQQDGNHERVGMVNEGQYINLNALFNDGRESATLKAARPTTILFLAREKFARLLAHNRELARALNVNASRDHHMHDVHFKTQREDEEVIHKTHLHPWAYIRFGWVPLIIIGACVALAVALPVLTLPIAFFCLLLVAVLSIYAYLEWKNDEIIITNQRVIHISHNILRFSEKRDEVMIESVQEANAEIPSLDPMAVLLRYGDVQIKTAGSAGNYNLSFVPQPQRVQDIIMEDRDRFMDRSQENERQVMRAELDRWLHSDQPTRQRSRQGGNQHESQQRGVKAVSEEQMSNYWTRSTGPISPFTTRFPLQDGGVVYRTHWVLWMRNMMLPMTWLLGTLVLGGLLLVLPVFEPLGFIGVAIEIVLLLIGSVWAYFTDWDWRNDYYIVSDNNITIINQRPLWLQNENDQVLLKRVDNVVAESNGILQQMFKYGDVQVSLVGADAPKVFHNVANPIEIQSEITRRQRRMETEEQEAERRQQREVIGEYISMYHDMNQQGQAPPIPQDAGYGTQNPPLPQAQQNQQNPPQPRISPGQSRASGFRDGNRPPKVPQQRQAGGANRGQNQPNPGMSSGRRYQPNAGNDYAPQPRPQTQPPTPERDSGRPPKFPRRRTDDE